MKDPNRNQLWARVLVEELSRAGVREVVVAPGSRSAPLVLAAAADPRLRLVVQVDERSAGFLALGVGKATGRPAAVITTSGTAAANLLPAVVEAAQSEAPLLLLTADRPPHLRGADANQAIDQVHLFGRYVRWFQEVGPGLISDRTLRHLRGVGSRAVAAAVGDPSGPVHLNCPFAKPLEPVEVPGDVPAGLEEESPLGVGGRKREAPFTRIQPRRAGLSREGMDALSSRIVGSRRLLVVAGPVPRPWEVGPALRGFARDRAVPVLADPLSGARFGGGEEDGVLGGYDLFLRSSSFRREARPDLILRVGAAPTSVALHDFLRECAHVSQVVVDGGERWKDHLSSASEYVQADPALLLERLRWEGGGEADWMPRWRAAESLVGEVLAREEADGDFFEGAILAEVARSCPGDRTLFVSSSMPVRDLDSFALPRPEPLPVVGNRGASGIDGIVSTACGVALGSGRRVVAVLGDLALVHDMNGLLALREEGVQVTLVVIQNDGGGIFHLLPIREYEPEFTRYFATPHGRDMARVASLYDLRHLRVEGRARVEGRDEGTRNDGADSGDPRTGLPGLRDALDVAHDLDESVLLEVRTDRDENRRRHEEVAARVQRALER